MKNKIHVVLLSHDSKQRELFQCLEYEILKKLEEKNEVRQKRMEKRSLQPKKKTGILVDPAFLAKYHELKENPFLSMTNLAHQLNISRTTLYNFEKSLQRNQ